MFPQADDKLTTERLQSWCVLAGLAAPVVSGALAAVAFPPIDASWLVWLALVPFFCAIADRRVDTAGLYFGAYVGGLVFHLLGLDWMRTSYGGEGLGGPRVWHWFLNAQVLAPIWVLIAWLGRHAVREHLPLVLSMPTIWVAAEFARKHLGWILCDSPYPWHQLGLTQADQLPVIQIADIAGVWGVTWVVVMVNAAIADVALAMSRGRSRRTAVGAVGAIALLAGTLLYGAWRLHQATTEDYVVVGLLPPDLDESELRVLGVPDEKPKCDFLLGAERQLSRDVRLDCALDEVGRVASVLSAPVLIGCDRVEPGSEDERRYNSVVAVDSSGRVTAYYDKMFLVPWSEFAPRIRPPGFSAECEQLTVGRTFGPFVFAKDGRDVRVASTICYDTCFPESHLSWMQAEGAAPDLFVACSAEGADGNGTLQEMIHRMTTFRAIECRRACVRNVSRGISGVTDGNGRHVQILESGRPSGEVVLTQVPIDVRFGPYSVLCDWLPIACSGIVIVCAVLSTAKARNAVA